MSHQLPARGMFWKEIGRPWSLSLPLFCFFSLSFPSHEVNGFVLPCTPH
jgi:hypothetical protein